MQLFFCNYHCDVDEVDFYYIWITGFGCAMATRLTWRPQGGHRGEQQITDAVTVHAATPPKTKHMGGAEGNHKVSEP